MERLAVLAVLALLVPTVLAQPGTVEVPPYPEDVAASARALVASEEARFGSSADDDTQQAARTAIAKARTLADEGRAHASLSYLAYAAGQREGAAILEASKGLDERNRRTWLDSEFVRLHDEALARYEDGRAALSKAEANLTTLRGFEYAYYSATWLARAGFALHNARGHMDAHLEAGGTDDSQYLVAIENAVSAERFARMAGAMLPIANAREAASDVVLNRTALDSWARNATLLGNTATSGASAYEKTTLSTLNPFEERAFAVALTFEILRKDRTIEWGVKTQASIQNGRADARDGLEGFIREQYGLHNLIGIAQVWGYDGVNMVDRYDLTAAVLEEDPAFAGDLAQGAGAMLEAQTLLRTFFREISPLAPPPEPDTKATPSGDGSEGGLLTPAPALVAVAGLAAAALLLGATRRTRGI